MSQSLEEADIGEALAIPQTPEPEPAYLQLEGVCISFESQVGGRAERVHVLERLDLSLSQGEFCCIVGPSGCGKSTTLRIIDGLQTASAGSVRLRGRPVTGPSSEIGFVFQNFNLLPWRSVLGNIEFGLENLGLSKADRRKRAREWLKVVDLEGFEDYYPAQLSGGMQQRVGLARAMAIEPQLLLMDEPFGSVDAQTRMVLQMEVLRIWERDQKTVLFVTHDIEEALFLADRVVIMSPRPSRVLRSVEVPFSRPRNDRLRGDALFARLKEEIWEELKATMSKDRDGTPPDG
jgi:NitT/TauT family transport system ATP-binding protein